MSLQVPICYNEGPQIRPQNYPFPWTDPQTQLGASCLDTSNPPSQIASISVQPFFHNPLDTRTHVRTHGQTNRWLPGKFDDYRPLSLCGERRGVTTTTTMLCVARQLFIVCAQPMLPRDTASAHHCCRAHYTHVKYLARRTHKRAIYTQSNN